MPRISRNRAIARLCAKWLENDLHRPRTTPTLAELLTEENVEAVATLDLYSQYDEDLAERDRRRGTLTSTLIEWQGYTSGVNGRLRK